MPADSGGGDKQHTGGGRVQGLPLPLPTATAQPEGAEPAARPLQPTKGMPVDEMEDISCKNRQCLQVKLLQSFCVTGESPCARSQGYHLLPSLF